MDIRFKNGKLRMLCEKQAVAVQKMGAAAARQLRSRLSDLGAAQRVTDLVAGHPHPLKGEREGQFAVSLAGGWRLMFAPANEPVPRREDTSIDWSAVTIVCIEYIGDYHD